MYKIIYMSEKFTNKIKIVNNDNLQLFLVLDKFLELLRIDMDNIKDQKELTAAEFRIRTLVKTLNIIKSFKEKIINGNDIAHFKGIGKKTIERINEILETKKLKEMSELEKKYKNVYKNEEIINDLTQVVGIGRITAIDLIKKYNIKSLDNLKERVELNEIEVNDKIKLGLKYVGKFFGNIPRKEMNKIADYLEKYTEQFKNLTVTFCGSYRREKSTSNDLDILLCSLDLITELDIKNSDLLINYVKKLKTTGFLIDDITSSAEIKTKYMGFCKYKNGLIRRIDMRLVPYNSYYASVLYFTGPYEFNTVMRSNAKKLGYKLSEYGLFKGKRQIYTDSEENIFNLLNMKYLSPKDRN